MATTHSHTHQPESLSVNKAFILGITLNSIFVVIELFYGFFTDSLALLTDAGHNLSDVMSLVLSLLAFRLAKLKGNETYTFGYKKSTILASLINAVILLIAVGIILWEAIGRFKNPPPMAGITVSVVAFVGIFINAITAYFFFQDKEKDINVKGAYLHLFADALVSAGVVVGGVIIYFTHLYWIDPLISIVIALVIAYSTFDLLKDSLRLSLDGVPHGIEIEKVKQTIQQTAGVVQVNHTHVWAISTTQNALTSHIVVEEKLLPQEVEKLKSMIRHDLEHLNIQHITLEIDYVGLYELDNEQCQNCQ